MTVARAIRTPCLFCEASREAWMEGVVDQVLLFFKRLREPVGGFFFPHHKREKGTRYQKLLIPVD